MRNQGYSALAMKPNGTQLFVGFNDRRLDSADKLRHTFGAVADINVGNGAPTFRPNFQVSASNYPGAQGNAEGDYDTAAADGSCFYYTWGDYRDIVDPSAQNVTIDCNVRFTMFPWPQ